MADSNNTIKTTVVLDATKAQQEIVKLNATASDATKSLEDRVKAKNKAVDLSNKLAKQQVDNLKKEVQNLKSSGAELGKVLVAETKLNKAKINAAKINANGAKAQDNLNSKLKDSKSATKNLDKATGGLLGKFKLFLSNPIGIAIAAITGGLLLLKEAFTSSEEGQNKFAKASAVLGTILGNLLDIVAVLAEGIVSAIEEPGKAWDSFVGTLESGYNFVKKQVIDRFQGAFNILSGTFQSGVLKMRIAWNEWTGDAKEANELTERLDEVNKKIQEGVDLINGANDQIVNIYKNAKDAVNDYINTQSEEIEATQRVADMRARADKIERALVVERSKLQSKVARLKLQAEQEELFSLDERLGFLREAAAAEDELLDKQLTATKLRAEAQTLENTFSRSNKANLDKEAELIAAVYNTETIRFKSKKRLQTKENTLIDERRALDKKFLLDQQKEDADKTKAKEDLIERDQEAQNTLDALDIERRRLQGENVLALELEFLERKRLQDIDNALLTAKEIEVINAESQAAKDKINKVAEKGNKKSADKQAEDGINAAAESFGVSKEIKIAEMVMAAPEAVGSSFKEAAKAYAPPLSLIMGAAGAAGVIVPIIKGLADIKKVRFPGKSKKAPSGGGGGGSISSATAPSTGITPSIVNDLAANNAARLGVDPSLGSQAGANASNSVQGGSSNSVVFSEGKFNDFQNQVAFKEEKTTI
jgi:hypothetical protein